MADEITDGNAIVFAHYCKFLAFRSPRSCRKIKHSKAPKWRALRRGIHEILTRDACLRHLAIQVAEGHQLMNDFLEHPEVR